MLLVLGLALVACKAPAETVTPPAPPAQPAEQPSAPPAETEQPSAPPAQAHTPSYKAKTYTNSQYGFSIQYKADWEARPDIAVGTIVAAFGVTAQPIPYQSLDEKPVRLVFLLIGKDNLVGPHIKLLSRISRLMNKEDFRNKLLDAKTPQEIIATFKQEEANYSEM